MTEKKARLIIIGPIPPPTHGVTASTRFALENRQLRQAFDVSHVDTSDRRDLRNIGKVDVQNLLLALRHVGAMLIQLRGRRGIVYLPLSNGIAFFRDSLFILAASLLRWKVAVHLHCGDFDRFYKTAGTFLRRWIRFTMKHVGSAGVLGDSLRPNLKALVPHDRIVVIANGVDDVALHAPAGRSPRPSASILFLSHLRRRKGVVEATLAALKVIEEMPEARFIFAGEWLDRDLEKELREKTASVAAIRFLPAVQSPRKEELLMTSSIFLFPPVLSEGQPLVLLEALAAGLPIVTTNRGAIAETVVDQECGYVLEHPDPTKLAERILVLLQDDLLRDAMGKAARRRYLQMYTRSSADARLSQWLTQLGSHAVDSR